MKRRVSPLSAREITAEHCSVGAKHEILRALPFFVDLQESGIAWCCGMFGDRGYDPGNPVYLSGQAALRLFVVARGKVKLIRTGAGGQNFLIDMLGDGDFFGSFKGVGEDTYSESAIAHVQSCVLAIEAGAFTSILSRFPSVSLRLVRILAERLRRAHEQLEILGGSSVEGRIAFTLLHLAQKFGEKRRADILLQLPLSREDLGEMAGTTTESASRIISSLHRDGVIRTGRRWISVVDRGRLSALVPPHFSALV